MGIVSIRIPQIGEGLQEARVVGFLKQEGDRIKRDEPIYQMETDKAVMDVESPVEGVIVRWLARPDDVVAIGAEIAQVETSAESDSDSGAENISNPVTPESPIPSAPKPRFAVPPRTRAYAAEKGLTEAQLSELASGAEKLMPSDIDEFLKNSAKTREYDDAPIASKQRILNSRLVRGSQLVVPGTMSISVDWEGVEREKLRLRSLSETFRPSSFTIFAYAVAQAVKEHPKFRTSLVGDETFRTYRHLSLGIAVSLPGDELALAVVEKADQLTWRQFVEESRIAISSAREGRDQAHEAVTLSLTNMQSFGLRDAVPVVVPPSMGTLFLGERYLAASRNESDLVLTQTCNIALTFDHRILNGVGAAQFMASVRKNVSEIERILAND